MHQPGVFKCIGNAFTHDVSGSVHIRIDKLTSVRSVQSTMNSCSGKRTGTVILLVYRHRVSVKKARLTGIGFFLTHDTNAMSFSLVFKNLLHPVKRYLNELLIVLMTDIDFLLPEWIISQYDGVDTVIYAP